MRWNETPGKSESDAVEICEGLSAPAAHSYKDTDVLYRSSPANTGNATVCVRLGGGGGGGGGRRKGVGVLLTAEILAGGLTQLHKDKWMFVF